MFCIKNSSGNVAKIQQTSFLFFNPTVFIHRTSIIECFEKAKAKCEAFKKQIKPAASMNDLKKRQQSQREEFELTITEANSSNQERLSRTS